MRKFLRYLRIGFSSLCAVACVLLIELWVRSYWHHDCFYCFQNSDNFGIESFRGNLLPVFQQYGATDEKWRFLSTPINDSYPKFRHPSFTWYNKLPSYFYVSIPHWFIAFLFAAFASALWIRWRFSVRALLIATTLLAVVLGLAVYAAKN